MLFQQIKARVHASLVLSSSYTVVRYDSNREGEEALVYRIRQKSAVNGKPSEKRVAKSEFEKACAQLMKTGEFSTSWFKKNIPSSGRAPCNFSVIGEVFLLLGVAHSHSRGKYLRQRTKATRQP